MSRNPADESGLIAATLADMLDAIDAIGRFTAGMSRESFADDEKTIFAVRAAFITLGEACGRLPQPFRDAHPEVPWRKVRHFRNFMIHVYDRIQTDPIWDTVEKDLPPLREQIQSLLPR